MVPKFNIRNRILVLVILTFAIISSSVSAYTSSVVVSDNQIGQIRSDFYGTNAESWGSNLSWIDVNKDNAIETLSNYTWHRDKMNESKVASRRTDMSLHKIVQSEGVFNDTRTLDNNGNILQKKDLVNQAYLNNQTVLFIADYMPEWLANKTSGWCNTTTGTNITCPPTNYTKWTNMIIQYMNLTNCGNYQTTCKIEVWNEPNNIAFYLNNITDRTSSIITKEYNKLCNATIQIKTIYPNIEVGCGATTVTSGRDEINRGILSNFSDTMDFFSIHFYKLTSDSRTMSDYLNTEISDLNKNITLYNYQGDILLSEIGEANNTVLNCTDCSLIGNEYSVIYSAFLNQQDKKYQSIMPYMWAGQSNYSGARSQNKRYEILAEPLLDNKLYLPYNITKTFATNHKAGNIVYSTSSSNSSLKVVASKDAGGKTYITLTNTLNENATTTLDTRSLTQTGYYLRDVETGQNYTSSNEVFNLGNISAYGVKTLSTEYYNVSVNFGQSLGVVNPWFYGVNNHGCWLTGCANNKDSTGSNIGENVTWQRERWNELEMNYIRNDMSLDSYYDGMKNLDLEDWTNASKGYFNSTTSSGARGWNVVAWTNGNGTVSRSADNHSGSYSLNVTGLGNYVGALSSSIYVYNQSVYNITFWAKGNGTVGIYFHKDFPYIGCASMTVTLNVTTWKQYSMNCTSQVNDTNFQFITSGIDKGEYMLLDDVSITQDGQPYWWWQKGNDTNRKNDMIYNKANNIRNLIILDYTPAFIADYSSGCNSTTNDCLPKNYTILAEVGLDWIDRIVNSTNNTDNIDIEIWNEPYGLVQETYGLDSINASLGYLKIYNATYWKIKSKYPNMPVGGPSGYMDAPLMMKTFLSNASSYGYKMDFVSHHPYATRYNSDYWRIMKNHTTWLKNLCTTYSSSGANCTRIINSEWNQAEYINNDTTQWAFVGEGISEAYYDLLSDAPERYSNNIYQWSSGYYMNYTPYTDSGYHYDMVSENDKLVYPVFNITKTYSKYASAQSTIKNSTSLYQGVKIVASTTSTGYDSIILTNTENNNKSIDIQVISGANQFIDTSSGKLYDSSDGVIENVTFNEYGVVSLTEPSTLDVKDTRYYYNYLGELLATGSIAISFTEADNEMCRGAAQGISNLGTAIYAIITILGIALLVACTVLLISTLNGNPIFDLSPIEIVGGTVIGIFILIVSAVTTMVATQAFCPGI